MCVDQSSGKVSLIWASRVAQWCRAVPPETLGSRPGSVAAGRDREVHGVRVGCVLCYEAVRLGWVGGRMAFDLRLSRAHTGVVAMRQDRNYNWIPRNWREKRVKIKNIKVSLICQVIF